MCRLYSCRSQFLIYISYLCSYLQLSLSPTDSSLEHPIPPTGPSPESSSLSLSLKIVEPVNNQPSSHCSLLSACLVQITELTAHASSHMSSEK